jgi:hypothetical protein
MRRSKKQVKSPLSATAHRTLAACIPVIKAGARMGLKQSEIAWAIAGSTGPRNPALGAYGKRLKLSTLTVYVNQILKG